MYKVHADDKRTISCTQPFVRGQHGVAQVQFGCGGNSAGRILKEPSGFGRELEGVRRKTRVAIYSVSEVEKSKVKATSYRQREKSKVETGSRYKSTFRISILLSNDCSVIRDYGE